MMNCPVDMQKSNQEPGRELDRFVKDKLTVCKLGSSPTSARYHPLAIFNIVMRSSHILEAETKEIAI
jgi:hypothetical protein